MTLRRLLLRWLLLSLVSPLSWDVTTGSEHRPGVRMKVLLASGGFRKDTTRTCHSIFQKTCRLQGPTWSQQRPLTGSESTARNTLTSLNFMKQVIGSVVEVVLVGVVRGPLSEEVVVEGTSSNELFVVTLRRLTR